MGRAGCVPTQIPFRLYTNRNLFTHLGLILYLLIEWKYFLDWYKKVNKLKTFERKIFEELNL